MNRIESYSRKATWPVAIALAAFIVAGCGSSSDSAPADTTPAVDPVGAVCTQGAACVDIGTASNYVILARDGGITSSVVSPSVVTGNVGMNADSTGITGFSLVMDASNTFATSTSVIGGGRVYASSYAAPTPAALTQAITDTGAAFTNATTRAVGGAGSINAFGGALGGQTLLAGVYEWTSAVSVAAGETVTLSGSATDVWVLRTTTGNITMNAGATVTLTGGALPQNVFWRSPDTVVLAAGANIKGIVLAGTSVTLADTATVNGRLLATTAVTLVGNTVTRPPL
jgi:hypothetical protein